MTNDLIDPHLFAGLWWTPARRYSFAALGETSAATGAASGHWGFVLQSWLFIATPEMVKHADSLTCMYCTQTVCTL